jgi:hypothetical protein
MSPIRVPPPVRKDSARLTAVFGRGLVCWHQVLGDPCHGPLLVSTLSHPTMTVNGYYTRNLNKMLLPS